MVWVCRLGGVSCAVGTPGFVSVGICQWVGGVCGRLPRWAGLFVCKMNWNRVGDVFVESFVILVGSHHVFAPCLCAAVLCGLCGVQVEVGAL